MESIARQRPYNLFGLVGLFLVIAFYVLATAVVMKEAIVTHTRSAAATCVTAPSNGHC